MARIFITGSADGLGRAAAETLLARGHDVIVHARSRDRLEAVRDVARVHGGEWEIACEVRQVDGGELVPEAAASTTP